MWTYKTYKELFHPEISIVKILMYSFPLPFCVYVGFLKHNLDHILQLNISWACPYMIEYFLQENSKVCIVICHVGCAIIQTASLFFAGHVSCLQFFL